LTVGNCCYVAVCSAAQGASAPTGRRGAGHIVAAARLQLVLNVITSLGRHRESYMHSERDYRHGLLRRPTCVRI